MKHKQIRILIKLDFEYMKKKLRAKHCIKKKYLF